MIISIDENTFEIRITLSPRETFIPTMQTAAIEEQARKIREQVREFRETKHDPMVRELITMSANWNDQNDPVLRARKEQEIRAAQEAAQKAFAEAEAKALLEAAEKQKNKKKGRGFFSRRKA